jgi:hypothetical protein
MLSVQNGHFWTEQKTIFLPDILAYSEKLLLWLALWRPWKDSKRRPPVWKAAAILDISEWAGEIMSDL